MRTKTTQQIPAREILDADTFTCDICGDVTYVQGEWSTDETKSEHIALRFTTTLGLLDAGGTRTSTEFDVCPKCFADTLVPWMKTHRGSDPTVHSITW